MKKNVRKIWLAVSAAIFVWFGMTGCPDRPKEIVIEPPEQLQPGLPAISERRKRPSVPARAVTSACADMKFDRTAVTLTAGGESDSGSVTLTLSCIPEGFDPADIVCISSDERIAAVRRSGCNFSGGEQNGGAPVCYTVRGVAEGSASVTARAGDKIAVCAITVSRVSGRRRPEPAPRSVSPRGPDGAGRSQQGLRDIGTAEQLLELAGLVNQGNVAPNRPFRLVSDIDLSSVCGANVGGRRVNWTPIGYPCSEKGAPNSFRGVFDGGGHKITGLYIDGRAGDAESCCYGLFGTNSGIIYNLTVSGTVSGGSESCLVGGICASNYGYIRDCCNAVRLSGQSGAKGGICAENHQNIKQCYNIACVTDGNRTGGIAGRNGGFISNSYSTESVSGSRNVGGICGENTGNVVCCYSTGRVSGRNNTGGIAGYNSHIINDCYALAGTAPRSIGRSDSRRDSLPKIPIQAYMLTAGQLADKASFVCWDFDSIWRIDPAFRRPTLTGFPESGNERLRASCI